MAGSRNLSNGQKAGETAGATDLFADHVEGCMGAACATFVKLKEQSALDEYEQRSPAASASSTGSR